MLKQPAYIRESLPDGDYKLVPNPNYNQLRDFRPNYRTLQKKAKYNLWDKIRNSPRKKWKEEPPNVNCKCCKFNFEHEEKTSKESRNDFESRLSIFKEKIKRLSKEEKLKELIHIAEYEKFKYNTISYKGLRKFHDDYKYQYFKVWKNCFICSTGLVENVHHIVMIKNGGTNDEANLIGVCKSCHAEIHPWLKT